MSVMQKNEIGKDSCVEETVRFLIAKCSVLKNLPRLDTWTPKVIN